VPIERVIGFTTGHGERRPVGAAGDATAGLLRAVLEDERFALEAVPGPIDAAPLVGFAGLILGEPTTALTLAEFEALDAYVRAGGCVLCLTSRGGLDWRPGLVPPPPPEPEPRPAPESPHAARRRRWRAFLFRESPPESPPPATEPEPPPPPPAVPADLLAMRIHDWQGDRWAALEEEATGPWSLGYYGGPRHQPNAVDRFAGSGPADWAHAWPGIQWADLGRGRVVFVDEGHLRLLLVGGDLLRVWFRDAPRREVARRQALPQRHRLLHGYPTRGGMRTPDDPAREDQPRRRELMPGRSLVVGVLPHSYCNPAVKGCGFCTFPHEPGEGRRAGAMVPAVIDEIARAAPFYRYEPERRPAVEALYLGGATANLTPAEPFAAICRQLARTFDLDGAEVSLEGVPASFLREPRLIDVLRAELGARHYRLSTGIQTFDPDRLRAMGRSAFGDASTFREVVDLAHREGLTVSGDFLFNLPGQSREAMRADVERAVDLGLDQICLYHLVLFDGLGVPWAEDRALLQSLPTNPEAAENWLALRELVLARGYTQTTLTNFERTDLLGTDRAYRYERKNKCPESHDMLGFGPTGISLYFADERAANRPWEAAVYGNMARHHLWMKKVANPEEAEAYLAAARGERPPFARWFAYHAIDQRILYITRKLALLSVDRRGYRAFSNGELEVDFSPEWEALRDAGLVTLDDEAVRLTPPGMFYADTIAGLIAWRAVRGRRALELAHAADGGGAHSRRLAKIAVEDHVLSRMG
jgi:oxygen-independent coproporphyrinogen-3 oxidase